MEFIHWDCVFTPQQGDKERFGCIFSGRVVKVGCSLRVRSITTGERRDLGVITQVIEFRRHIYLRVRTTKGKVVMTIAPLVY